MMATTLSPATRRGLFSTLIQQEHRVANEKHPGKKPGSGEIRRIVMYECLNCAETYEDDDEARDCCPVEDEVLEPFEREVHCPVCNAFIGLGDYRGATDCCLWHDFDAYTRWAIADKVEAGATWAEAIAQATGAGK